MTNNIEHSALGSHWTKKNHKYIRKEGNRYIYPEDLKKSSGYRGNLKEDLKRQWESQVTDPINNRKAKKARSKETKARLKELDEQTKKRVELEQRLNKREKWLSEEPARREFRENYVNTNRRIIAQKKANETAKRLYNRQKQVVSERQAKSGHDERGFKVNQIEPKAPYGYDNRGFKKKTIEPKGPSSHDSRGFRNNNPVTSTDYDERGFKLSRKLSNRNRSEAEAAAKAEAEHRKEVQEKGKAIYKQRVKDQKERAKQARKRIDKQLPKGMKLKRDIKRGKKALKKFFNWQ